MKQFVFEIVRQKWRVLSVIAFLLLLNIVLAVFSATYQQPEVARLRSRWSDLRLKSAGHGPADVTTLHQQGVADLEKLGALIPEKRQFARVLSVFIEAAGNSAVEMGTISYKPVAIKDQNLLSYQISLSVSGSYAAVKSYLSDLQKNRELLVVDSVSFSNGDLFIENVVMSLSITVYLREGA